MRKFDNIKFKVHSDKKYFDLEVLINDESFLKDFCANIYEYDDMLKKSGHYELFTCSCGVEGCAGIFKTPYVEVKDDSITWNIYEPNVCKFMFKKDEIKNAVLNLKKDLLKLKSKKYWDRVEYLYGFRVGEFLKESTIKKPS